MTKSKRAPYVAGSFYEGSKVGLKKQIEGSIYRKVARKEALACILPHAGYMYSGGVAGRTVSSINVKDRVLLLGPNHTGMGSAFSIMSEGAWETPLGEVNIDTKLAAALLKNCSLLKEDSAAHEHEHSLEVELPFLQYFNPDIKIVPIAISSTDLSAFRDAGKDIAKVLASQDFKDKVLLVASSDMTHYEPQKEAERKDNSAIEAILRLDADKLAERIERLNISMCGYAPVLTLISALRELGVKKGELIKYQTSGDVTGDKGSVVGYAGIIF